VTSLKTSTGTQFRVRCVIISHTDLIANELLENFVLDNLEHYVFDLNSYRYFIPETEPLSSIILMKFPFLTVREVAYVITEV
jgi:hypothetical protein